MELLDMATELVARGYDVEAVKWYYETEEEWIINQYNIEMECKKSAELSHK